MRILLSRFSDWVVVQPVLWRMGSGAALVLLGFALDLTPIVVIAAGAAIAVLNILHARRRGYCPLPAEPGSPRDEREPGSRPGVAGLSIAFTAVPRRLAITAAAH